MVDELLSAALNLKRVHRQGWVDRLSMENPESVADHTFAMAIIGMLMADSEGYDTKKTLKMILLHDLAESETGDYTPDQISKEEKLKLEEDTLAGLLKGIPRLLKEDYQRIWHEYTKGSSAESKLVHDVDKFEMAIQAKMYERDGFPKEKLQTFYDTARQEIHHPKLKELFTKMCE